MAEMQHRHYEEDEAEEILKRASSLTSPIGGMSRDRLLETAAELGITPEAVERAEREIAASKSELSERAEFDQRIRRDFYGHLASYVIVNGFLCTINLIQGGRFWAIWPLLGWGIGIAFGVVETFFRNSEDYQEEFEKWRSKKGKTKSEPTSQMEDHELTIDRYIQIRLAEGKSVNKLDAIYFLRQESGLGLSEAKGEVDGFLNRHPDLFH